MELLVRDGVDGITVEALTQQLGVTKGSFYHHFRDTAHFKAEALAYCLSQNVGSVIARANAGSTPFARLFLLTDMAATVDPLEVAIRAWALQDADVRATLTAIDQQRLAYVIELHQQLGLDPVLAQQAAHLFYCTFLGGMHLLPTLTHAQLHDMFAALRRLYGISEGAYNNV